MTNHSFPVGEKIQHTRNFLFAILLLAIPAWLTPNVAHAVVIGNHKGTRVYHFHSARDVEFGSNAIHVIHPSAMANMDKLMIRGVANAKIYFLGDIKGTVPTKSHWQVDRGVVNIVQCENLLISGLKAENLQRYEPVVGLGKNESTALNIVHSKRITIANSTLTGEGKGVVVVSSDSAATIKDTTINGYYFELQVGASNVRCENVTFNQHNKQVGDSHTAIWVSSSMRSEVDKKLYKSTNVVLQGHTFNMKSGRGIVAGNGMYDARSKITFEDVPKFNHTLKALGLVVFHKNYHGIEVVLRKPIPNLVDVVRASVSKPTVGRYVIYHTSPGQPAELAANTVDGLSSEAVKP